MSAKMCADLRGHCARRRIKITSNGFAFREMNRLKRTNHAIFIHRLNLLARNFTSISAPARQPLRRSFGRDFQLCIFFNFLSQISSAILSST